MNEAANQLSAWQILAHYDQVSEQNSASVSRAQSSGELLRGLQCKVGEHSTLVPQSALLEVLPLPEITEVPGGPAWLIGLANRYGQLLPVVDAYGFITNKASKVPARSLLVIGLGDNVMGLALSHIGQPISVHRSDSPPDQISKSAAMPSTFNQFMHSWATAGDRWHPILDVEKLQHSINQWQD
jgi:chemotaxis signal transduction protein